MRHFAAVWDGNIAIPGFRSPESVMSSLAAQTDQYLDWVELTPASHWATIELGDDPGQVSVPTAVELTAAALAGEFPAPVHLLVAELTDQEVGQLLNGLVIAGESALADKLAGLIA